MSKNKGYIFDLDNTLVFTDELNNEAYNRALEFANLDVITTPTRITRDIVFNQYPYLSANQRNEIVEFKQTYFLKNLSKTYPNTDVMKLILSDTSNKYLLWTRADEKRVKALLSFYEISDVFDDVFYSNKQNVKRDVKIISQTLNFEKTQLVFYEDNQRIISELQALEIMVISCPS